MRDSEYARQSRAHGQTQQTATTHVTKNAVWNAGPAPPSYARPKAHQRKKACQSRHASPPDQPMAGRKPTAATCIMSRKIVRNGASSAARARSADEHTVWSMRAPDPDVYLGSSPQQKGAAAKTTRYEAHSAVHTHTGPPSSATRSPSFMLPRGGFRSGFDGGDDAAGWSSLPCSSIP